MFELKRYLEKRRETVDQLLDEKMPTAKTRPALLHEAMRYSVFSGGKRLRPTLCLAAAEAVGGKIKQALVPAGAIELLHTYTLIHDDLPAMDDDELRRGKPTCHIKFGEANAILAGDALLTMAFEWLAGYPELTRELAQAAGSEGVIAGQVEDLAAESRKPDKKLLQYIHSHKTAKLIQASVRLGVIAGRGSKKEVAALGDYGEKIGLAFQIMDDVLDEKKDEQMTAITVYGKEQAMIRARRLIQAAKRSLKKVSRDTTALAALADFVVERKT